MNSDGRRVNFGALGMGGVFNPFLSPEDLRQLSSFVQIPKKENKVGDVQSNFQPRSGWVENGNNHNGGNNNYQNQNVGQGR